MKKKIMSKNNNNKKSKLDENITGEKRAIKTKIEKNEYRTFFDEFW